MIIIMKSSARNDDIDNIAAKIKELGFLPHISSGEEKTIIGIIGNERRQELKIILESMPEVESIIPILKPFKLASREFKSSDTEIQIDGILIGGKEIAVVAGPCAVENREQLLLIAEEVKASGVKIFRGGAFKPRTSPYSFQGLGEDGLKLLREVKERTGLLIVTEVLSPETLDLVSEYADILQIGARNMQNFSLLQKAGKSKKPVLLKRGMMNSMEELLMSAEYILANGNQNVILCERGIRTFEKYTRFTLDISAVPILKSLSHLPVMVDPSHAAGKWEYVPSLSKSAVASGCDGLIIEVHHDPASAFSDGLQSLKPKKFASLMKEMDQIARASGRYIIT